MPLLVTPHSTSPAALSAPTDFANCALWYDASVDETVVPAAAVNGDVVYRSLNKGSEGGYWQQNTSGQRPTHQTISSKAVTDYSASSPRSLSISSTWSSVDKATFAVVCQTPASLATYAGFLFSGTSANTGLIHSNATGKIASFWNAADNGSLGPVIPLSTNCLLAASVTLASLRLYVFSRSGGVSWSFFTTTRSALSVTHLFQISRDNNSSSRQMAGSVFHALVYKGTALGVNDLARLADLLLP